MWFQGMSRMRLWAAELAEEMDGAVLSFPRRRLYAGNWSRLHSTLYNSLEAFRSSLATHVFLCSVANRTSEASMRPGFRKPGLGYKWLSGRVCAASLLPNSERVPGPSMLQGGVPGGRW